MLVTACADSTIQVSQSVQTVSYMDYSLYCIVEEKCRFSSSPGDRREHRGHTSELNNSAHSKYFVGPSRGIEYINAGAIYIGVTALRCISHSCEWMPLHAEPAHGLPQLTYYNSYIEECQFECGANSANFGTAESGISRQIWCQSSPHSS